MEAQKKMNLYVINVEKIKFVKTYFFRVLPWTWYSYGHNVKWCFGYGLCSFINCRNIQCSQPQTREHLVAVENMNLENIIIVQNKIDLIKEENAKENYN